jgi:hypothetical protein
VWNCWGIRRSAKKGSRCWSERIRLVAVQAKGSLILYLVFVAPDTDFDLMRPAFDRILRSFAPR